MSGESIGEKNAAIGAQWATLTDEEKKAYNQKATDSMDLKKLTGEEKAKLVKKHLKQLGNEVRIIQ